MCWLDLRLFAADCHQVGIMNPDWWPQVLQSRIPMGPSALKRFISFGFSWSTKLSCKSTRSTKNTAGSRSTPALEKTHPLGLTGPYVRMFGGDKEDCYKILTCNKREEQREDPTITNTNTYILWHFAMTIIDYHPRTVHPKFPHWGARLGPHVAQLFQTCPTALAAVLAVSPVARGFPPMASVQLKSLHERPEKDRKKEVATLENLRSWRLLKTKRRLRLLCGKRRASPSKLSQWLIIYPGQSERHWKNQKTKKIQINGSIEQSKVTNDLKLALQVCDKISSSLLPEMRFQIRDSMAHKAAMCFRINLVFKHRIWGAMDKQHLPWLNTLSSFEKDVWCFVFLELHLDATHCWERNTSCWTCDSLWL